MFSKLKTHSDDLTICMGVKHLKIQSDDLTIGLSV